MPCGMPPAALVTRERHADHSMVRVVPKSNGRARLDGTCRMSTGSKLRPLTWGYRSAGGQSSVQVVAQDLRAAGVAQLRHGLGLDLPDPLTGDPVDLADHVQRARLAVGEAEPQPDDAG